MASDRIDFINEDDAGRILLALLKQVADAAGADADEHFNEIRTGNREERNVRFTRNSAGEQRLACAGRSDQQHAFGNPSTEFLELLGFPQELDNLLQLFLGFFDAGDIFERDFLLLRGMQAGAALAEAERFISAALHLAHHEDPECQQEHERNGVDEDRNPVAGGLFSVFDIDAIGSQFVDHLRIIHRDDGMEFLIAARVNAVQFVAGDRDRLDLFLLHIAHQLRERGLGVGPGLSLPDYSPKQNNDHDDDDPEYCCFNVGIHAFSLQSAYSGAEHPLMFLDVTD